MDVDELEDKKVYRLKYRDNTMDKGEWVDKVFYYEKSQKQDLKRVILDLIQQRRGKGFMYKIKPVAQKEAKKLIRKKKKV